MEGSTNMNDAKHLLHTFVNVKSIRPIYKNDEILTKYYIRHQILITRPDNPSKVTITINIFMVIKR